MFRDDVNMNSRSEVLAYRDQMLKAAALGGPGAEAHRGLAEDLLFIAESLPDETPEKSPRNGLAA